MKKYEILLAQSEENLYHPILIRGTLEKEIYQVTTEIGSGPSIEIFSKKEFDLVITDILAVLEKAKELNPETMAILMLTTSAKSMLTIHAVRSAADDYLFMPFELAELEVRVALCIEKLELKKRNGQDHSNEKIETLLKTLSYDIRGALMSMTATLKLLSQGYYGEMDEEATNRLKELVSKTLRLTGMTEACLGETWSAGGALKMEGPLTKWVPDRVSPTLKEFPYNVREGFPRLL